MRFEDQQPSRNVEDRRGAGPGLRAGRIGIGTVVLVVIAMVMGVDPSVIFEVATAPSGSPATSREAGPRPAAEDRLAEFVSLVLGDTEKTWHRIFSDAGKEYQEPTLVLFTGATSTACGQGQAAMGPFYCPEDLKVYIDLDFYQELRGRFRAPGDFAQAYVIAHEIGHHVQNLLGISGKVQAARQRISERQGNALSVSLELQADCLAGMWAHHADRARGILEAGDVEEALAAASAIGDDRLQEQARGYAVPDSFTHGTSEQRVEWFRRGLQTGSFRECDTFAAERR